MRSQMHQLQLVYPPISNQEAEWIKNDKEVQKILKKSKLYFIGQKPESFYSFKKNVIDIIQKEKILPFDYIVGKKTTSGYFDLISFIEFHKIPISDEIEIELGPKLIRFWTENKDKVIAWFTTEKILFDKWRNIPYIKGFNDYQKFSLYQLHYIGISKSGDSLKRLIIKPHDKRLRILSNEHPLSKGSRITDELILFFFEIDSLEIKQYLDNKDFSEFGTNELKDRKRIIIDAEKAFVKIMDTQYNEVKFKNYPISDDGLYNSSVERYSFSINEDICFFTADNIIRGKRDCMLKNYGYDFIVIDKNADEVNLIKL